MTRGAAILRAVASPRDLYTSRLSELSARSGILNSRAGAVAHIRVVTFGTFLLMAWLSIGREWFSAAWILLPAALFVGLLIVHDRIRQQVDRASRLTTLYQFGLARLDGTWAGKGDRGDDFAEPHHPYAGDLDLFGSGSLFELLSRAQTSIGRATLAQWLLSRPSIDEINARRDAVTELKERPSLHEKLALLEGNIGRALQSHTLRDWAAASSPGFRVFEKIAALLIAAGAVVAMVLLFSGRAVLPAVVAIAVEMLFSVRLSARIAAVRDPVFRAATELTRIAGLLQVAASESFTSPRLHALFADGRTDAVRAVKQLIRLVDLLDAMRNQFFAPIGALLLWNAQISFRIERWRGRWGKELVRWMDNVGEFEALVSLGGFAFEHPEYAIPRVGDTSGDERREVRDESREAKDEGRKTLDQKLEGSSSLDPRLSSPAPRLSSLDPRLSSLASSARVIATNLAHPLLGPEAVGNDVSIGDPAALWIVSGSNMSGKSTLLRSIGTNIVLAYCGAPVRASAMEIGLMSVGASIRINDSLQEGSSRFYAEVSRMKQIVDLSSGEVPLLFLLDEIFNGTNSHDRRIGAEAVLRRLVDANAIGLVTTHDLALARLSETMPGKAVNVHFEDHLENGRMTFDYRLRECVVTRSNALELMRAVGLEV